MRLENYLTETDITYEQYCHALDCINEGVVDTLTGKASKVFDALKTELTSIAKNFDIGMEHMIHAVKNLDMFHLLKAVGFNLKTLLKSVHAFAELFRKGLHSVFKELHDTRAFQKIKAGTLKVDDVLEQHPILKKVSGPVVAGLLFYIWTQMTFIGNMDYDFDFSNISKALAGNFSLADLFASPEGMMLSTLFMTGGLISAPWLGSTMYNLVLAITYTLIKNKGVELETVKKMRNSLKLEKL